MYSIINRKTHSLEQTLHKYMYNNLINYFFLRFGIQLRIKLNLLYKWWIQVLTYKIRETNWRRVTKKKKKINPTKPVHSQFNVILHFLYEIILYINVFKWINLEFYFNNVLSSFTFQQFQKETKKHWINGITVLWKDLIFKGEWRRRILKNLLY